MSQLFSLGDLQFSLSSDNVLGSGSNGKVFKGTYKGEFVAVKKFSLDSVILQSEQHWETLIKLRKNEHLVKYHECKVQDNFRYLVMEFCQGSMLDYCSKSINDSGGLFLKTTDIMWQLICAIDFLHYHNISHGDLKLENVLFWKRDPKSKRTVVKLTGYGYNCENITDRQNRNDTDINHLQLGCLFFSAATKNLSKPSEPVPPNSLTEIDDDEHKALASKFIRILINPSYSNRFQIGTLLRHPLFTRCSEAARLKLKNDQTLWKDELKLLLWRKCQNENKFSDESFDDLKDIFLSNDDTSELVNEAFKTTPRLFSEYIWHTATKSVTVPKENNKTHSIEKLERLGKGNYGTVYKCEYSDGKGIRGYPAACKKSKSKPEAEEVFSREIETLRKLDHLFVVKYLDVIEKDFKKYIVMELCEGSVKDYVEGNLKQIPKDSLDEKILVGQVTLGLAYIHDKGIIHKDLKLENILLKRHSPRLVVAKIADFGFAKELKPGKTEFSKTEHPGTDSYMAPELLKAPDGAYPASFASDVYALGITIARIVLKGEHPFSSNKTRRNVSMFQGLVPPNLQNLSWDLIDLILKLTEKDPGKRPEMSLVLRHPYFALTNDITKRHFADQLWTDFNSIPYLEGNRIKIIRKVFSRRSFREWYKTFSNKDNLAITDEEINEIENNIPLFTELKPEMKVEDILGPAKGYMKIINEAVTSEYNIEIGDTINLQFFQNRNGGFSKYRLYKLIQRVPKLLVSYFWSHLLEGIGSNKTNFPELESQNITMIPELQWSSLYYNDEDLIEELWKIKYLENQTNFQETVHEMVMIIGKCNVSENAWSTLFDRITEDTETEDTETENFWKLSLLMQAVQSYAPNAPKVTEMILGRCCTESLIQTGEFFIHMFAASNVGNWAAEIMKVLLKYPFNFGKNSLGLEIDFAGIMSLFFAVQNESQSGPKIVELLLNKGVNPNTPYLSEGFTPVYFAASNQGDYAAHILKLLLDGGGECNIVVNQSEPIHVATVNFGSSALELFNLLARKRGFNVIHETSGFSLIHFVATNFGVCGPNILKKLLDNGANVNDVGNNKITPLHLAAKDCIFKSNQQISIMKILLKNGGNPNAVDEYGRTPVHFAASSLSGEHADEKLKLLLDNGGKSTSNDANGLNPVHYTLLNMGVRGAEMRKLIGVDRKSTNVPLNSNGMTLLHWIVFQKTMQIQTLSDPSKHYRKVDLVQLILDNGGNPNAVDEKGHSSVHRAVFLAGSYDGLSVLKLLLEKGGDPNLLDKEEYAPIHYTAQSVSKTAPEMMKILLENGGDANVSGKNGLTPLHITAIQNEIEKDQIRIDVVKLLLEKCANPNAGDKEGRTPVHYVVTDKRIGTLNVLKLLLAHGGNILQKDSEGITPHLMATRIRSKQYCHPKVKKLIVKTYRKMK